MSASVPVSLFLDEIKHRCSVGMSGMVGMVLWLFICSKTKLKKKRNFFEKIFVFFTKYLYKLFAEKNVFIWRKSSILKNILLKKIFFTAPNLWYSLNESDKSRAWRAYVLTCLRASVLSVLACFTCLRVRVLGVLLCSHALRAYVLDEMFYFLTCLRAWRS